MPNRPDRLLAAARRVRAARLAGDWGAHASALIALYAAGGAPEDVKRLLGWTVTTVGDVAHVRAADAARCALPRR